MPFLGMSFGNSDNNNNSSNNNSNNNSILDVLYHNTMQQKKLKQEQDEQKNSLLNQMEGYVEPKHVLYSSVDDLKKMRDDLLSKNLIKPSLPLPTSTANTPNTTNPNNNQPQPQPQNPLQSIQNSSDTQVPTPALLPKINPKDRVVETFSQKPALLPKIDPDSNSNPQKPALLPKIDPENQNKTFELKSNKQVKKAAFKDNQNSKVDFVQGGSVSKVPGEQQIENDDVEMDSVNLDYDTNHLYVNGGKNPGLKAGAAESNYKNRYDVYTKKAYQEEQNRIEAERIRKYRQTHPNTPLPNFPMQEEQRQFVDYNNKENREMRAKQAFEKDVRTWDWKINLARIPLFNRFGSLFYGSDSVNMLNLSNKKIRPFIYSWNAVKVNGCFDKKMSGYNDGKLNQFIPHIYNKIKEQFKDYGYDPKKVQGYIFKPNSAAAKRIKQSQDFEVMVAQNIHKIVNNENFSGRFSNPGWRGSNLHNAFGSVEFLNAGVDENGNVRLYMFDTYDFNKGENAKVEAGRRKMMKKDIKGYYTVHEILISQDELDNILNKYYYIDEDENNEH